MTEIYLQIGIFCARRTGGNQPRVEQQAGTESIVSVESQAQGSLAFGIMSAQKQTELRTCTTQQKSTTQKLVFDIG